MKHSIHVDGTRTTRSLADGEIFFQMGSSVSHFPCRILRKMLISSSSSACRFKCISKVMLPVGVRSAAGASTDPTQAEQLTQSKPCKSRTEWAVAREEHEEHNPS